MRELGIANAVLEAARAEIQRCPGMRLRKVPVRGGELAGVNQKREAMPRGKAAPVG